MNHRPLWRTLLLIVASLALLLALAPFVLNGAENTLRIVKAAPWAYRPASCKADRELFVCLDCTARLYVCNATGDGWGGPTWSPVSIAPPGTTGQVVYNNAGALDAMTGYSGTKVVKGSDGENCNLVYLRGVLASTTCP